MRKFLIFIFVLLLFISSPLCKAEDDVVLDVSVEDGEVQETAEEASQEKLSLYEKIQNIRAKEFKKDEVDHLLKGILTKNFEKGFVDDIQFFSYYRDGFDMEMPEGSDSDFLYRINVLQAGFKGHFKNRNTQYENN